MPPGQGSAQSFPCLQQHTWTGSRKCTLRWAKVTLPLLPTLHAERKHLRKAVGTGRLARVLQCCRKTKRASAWATHHVPATLVLAGALHGTRAGEGVLPSCPRDTNTLAKGHKRARALRKCPHAVHMGHEARGHQGFLSIRTYSYSEHQQGCRVHREGALGAVCSGACSTGSGTHSDEEGGCQVDTRAACPKEEVHPCLLRPSTCVRCQQQDGAHQHDARREEGSPSSPNVVRESTNDLHARTVT